MSDNIAECRSSMLDILTDYLKPDESDELYQAMSYVPLENENFLFGGVAFSLFAYGEFLRFQALTQGHL